MAGIFRLITKNSQQLILDLNEFCKRVKALGAKKFIHSMFVFKSRLFNTIFEEIETNV